MALNIPSLTVPSTATFQNAYGVILGAELSGPNTTNPQVRVTVSFYVSAEAFAASAAPLDSRQDYIPAVSTQTFSSIISAIYASLLSLTPTQPEFLGATIS